MTEVTEVVTSLTVTSQPAHVIDIPLLLVLIAATLMGSFGNAMVIGAIFVNKVIADHCFSQNVFSFI